MIISQGYISIAGLGAYVPQQKVSSVEIMRDLRSRERFGIPEKWLERALGVRERHVAEPQEKPSDLAIPACQEALDRAHLLPEEIDLLIYAGMNRDYIEPATAHVVADRIGASGAVCVDLTNACHGFMNGIHYANALVASGDLENVLICAGENNWRIGRSIYRDIRKLKTRAEFERWSGALSVGDAGAAMVLVPKADQEIGFDKIMMHSDASHRKLCVLEADENNKMIKDGVMDMVGISRAHLGMHQQYFHEFLSNELKWESEGVDHFVHHQVGRAVFKKHEEYSGIPMSKMSNTFTEYGNITAATIPFNLHKLLIDNDIDHEDKTFISGSGSGLSISQSGYSGALSM